MSQKALDKYDIAPYNDDIVTKTNHIAPCYENKTRSKKLNLDNKCFQQL